MKNRGFTLIEMVIVLAIMGAQALIATRPTVPKTTPIERSTFVNVLTARLQNERAMVSAFGTVKAYQELTVQPEVSGRVVAHHPSLPYFRELVVILAPVEQIRTRFWRALQIK